MLSEAEPLKLSNLIHLLELGKQGTTSEYILQIETEVSKLKAELALFKKYFNATYYYSGTFPNCRAHSDFKQLMSAAGLAVFEPGFRDNIEPRLVSSVLNLELFLSGLANSANAVVQCSEFSNKRIKSAHEAHIKGQVLANVTGLHSE